MLGMNSNRQQNHHRPRKRQMQELVAEACGLVHHPNGIGRVHIVGANRPTYRQLRRYRKTADDDRVHLRVDRVGVITIWQEER